MLPCSSGWPQDSTTSAYCILGLQEGTSMAPLQTHSLADLLALIGTYTHPCTCDHLELAPL